tara:strand:+ start:9921 stop:10568 length:648 start_codon:yes stop_codon:yes gene_type:complete
MTKFKPLIKICGITSTKQALQIAALGVDAIGIISVKESPRYVSGQIKKEIFGNLEKFFPRIKRVSVIKNIQIKDALIKLIDYENVLQLHGDEDLEYCKEVKREIPDIEIWKAFRIKTSKDIEMIKDYKNFIDAALLDSWNKETYGGSGIRISRELLENISINKQWWLAGGISIDWIQQIIQDIQPNGIDISSSIEKSPGIKDIGETKKLIKFIKQ